MGPIRHPRAREKRSFWQKNRTNQSRQCWGRYPKIGSRKLGAQPECLVSKATNAVPDIHIGQARTRVKGSRPDIGDTVGDCHVCKGRASKERIEPNGGNIGRDHDADESRATRESLGAYTREACGKCGARKPGAASESAHPYICYTVGNCDALQ